MISGPGPDRRAGNDRFWRGPAAPKANPAPDRSCLAGAVARAPGRKAVAAFDVAQTMERLRGADERLASPRARVLNG
jgi:hypothetical protein